MSYYFTHKWYQVAFVWLTSLSMIISMSSMLLQMALFRSFLWLSRISLCVCVCVAVLSLSHVRLFATQWTAARQASLSFTISQSLLKLLIIESVMPSNHLILCQPLLLLPPIFPRIRVFSFTLLACESVLCNRWPKYWSFSSIISPSNE